MNGDERFAKDMLLPAMVEWELTRRCDLDCAHCYAGPGQARRGELDTAAALDVVRRLGRLGCRSVTLSGGEPTLRGDWPVLAQALREQGVGVQLFSNGQHLAAAAARSAREAGVRLVMLSLDGRERTHDWIRGRRGVFARVLEAARALDDEGVAIGVSTVVLRPNQGELEAVAELATSLGARLWTVWLGIPHRPSRMWLELAELPALAATLRRLRQVCPILTVGDNLAAVVGERRLRHLAPCRLAWPGARGASDATTPASTGHCCPAGDRTMGLRSDGTVVGCLALPCSTAADRHRGEPLAEQWRRARADRAARGRLIAAAGRPDPLLAAYHGGCHATALAAGLGGCVRPEGATRALRCAARRAATVAASILTATGACSPREPATGSPTPPPAQTSVAVLVPSASPAPNSTASAASVASSPATTAHHDPNEIVPLVPDSSAPPSAPGRPFPSSYYQPGPGGLPRCCMMHILVPDCDCTGGATTP